ncbi:murein biosynthesis integral membrane protein MurJ [Fusobacterium sp. MFO224]|uniref:murein biosynthesis integral membrane protein MurJ n=1 Tax=Fusobacterium sp. MFO224 TaxID=3378070 RepID=UPI003852D9DA
MFKSGFFMMIITLVSRVLGLARSVVIAYYFGASASTDAFFSAFKISNFFRQLLGEGALGTSFIPLYNEKVKVQGEEEGRNFIFSIMNIVFIFSIVVAIFTAIFSKEIIGFIVGGFSHETQMIASYLLRIMSSYFIFIALAGMMGAILNNFRCFALPASTSIFFNLAILGSAIFFGRKYGIQAMAYGILVGGAMQLLILIPTFLKKVRGYKFKIIFKDEYLKKLLFLILPMLVGIFARQINTMIDQFFASYLQSGGVSALENATRLYSLPIGVFGISISTVIYPTLSKKIVNNDLKAVEDNILKGLNILMFFVIPSMAVFCFYSKEVVSLLFGYGKFGEEAVNVTGSALLFYSLGLYFYTAIHLLTRSFYGMKNSKDPVKFSVISIIINIVLNALLIGPLKYRGLALSTSIAAMCNFYLLFFYFRKKYIKLSFKPLVKFKTKVLITTAISILGSFYIDNIIIKLGIFSLIYLSLWAYPIYKKKLEVF